MKYLIPLCLAAGGWAHAQQIDLSSLDKLESRAKESRIISLDADKLHFAGEFLPGDENTRKLYSGLKGVFVRSFEFRKPNTYAQTDLAEVRKQLKAPGWSKIVDVREEDGESSEIYFFSDKGMPGGMTIIAAERDELTVVNIIGPLDLASMGKLVGTIVKGQGIPGQQKRKDDDDN